jgi:hypothetical protein
MILVRTDHPCLRVGHHNSVRLTSLWHSESLSVVSSKMDAYDLIIQKGILSSNLSHQSIDGRSRAAFWQ